LEKNKVIGDHIDSYSQCFRHNKLIQCQEELGISR